MNFFLQQLTPHRNSWVEKVVCFFFAMGIVGSYNLWINTRFFPVIPVLEWSIIPYPFDLIILMITVVCLLISMVSHYKIVYIILFCLLIALFIQDQIRWQPWVYFYTLILLPFLVIKNPEQNNGLNQYFRLLIAGVYVWSGLHKFNSNFITITFTDVCENFLHLPDIKQFSYLGYAIPAIEVTIGITLLFRKTRNTGIVLGIITHIFTLVYLSSLGIGSNSIVYPWNIAMILLLLIVFYNIDVKEKHWKEVDTPLRLLIATVILLIWILPAFNFLQRWDHYLSFSLYSNKTSVFYIAIEDRELHKIDPRYELYFVHLPGMSGGQLIDVDKWSRDELNVPFNPETRIFKKLSESFCKLGIEDSKLIFIEFEKPLSEGKLKSFRCTEN